GREARLMAPLLEFLHHRRGVRLLGRPHTEGRAPTLAFTCAGIAPWALSQHLAAENIGIGAGNFYAWRLLEALGIDPNIGVARLSLVHYTSEQEVARVISALDRLLPAAS
ncbi:MAG: aminotransferase class V-fold PLP-dependent enzyme, partial [Steroidobacteraceae bacterium]